MVSANPRLYNAAPMFHLVDAFAIYAVTAVAGRHTLQLVFDAAATLRAIQREGVTVINLASTMVRRCRLTPPSG